MSGALRVLVVDDQQLLRRGLVMLFGTVDGVDVVAQAAHGAEALAVLTVSDHLLDHSADLTATERETMFEDALEIAVAALLARG